MLTRNTVAVLHRYARAHSRVAHEAEDLVQDVLLAAIASGRDCSDPMFLAWARGAIRNHAKHIARGAARRRRREQVIPFGLCSEPPPLRVPDVCVVSLPPAQRVVARLINGGMTRREIGFLLSLSDVALRKRLSGLRRSLAKSGTAPEHADAAPFAADGKARRNLKATLPAGLPWRLAVRDPDGNPVFFSARGHVSGLHGNCGGQQLRSETSHES